jgi:hypothetical protein
MEPPPRTSISISIWEATTWIRHCCSCPRSPCRAYDDVAGLGHRHTHPMSRAAPDLLGTDCRNRQQQEHARGQGAGPRRIVCGRSMNVLSSLPMRKILTVSLKFTEATVFALDAPGIEIVVFDLPAGHTIPELPDLDAIEKGPSGFPWISGRPLVPASSDVIYFRPSAHAGVMHTAGGSLTQSSGMAHCHETIPKLRFTTSGAATHGSHVRTGFAHPPGAYERRIRSRTRRRTAPRASWICRLRQFRPAPTLRRSSTTAISVVRNEESAPASCAVSLPHRRMMCRQASFN